MIDFQEISRAALAQYPGILESWLPGGKLDGKEYVAGNLQGEPGRSLSVNTGTGVWKDFSTDEGGQDPVSLYAAIHGLSQGEAARQLGELLRVNGNGKARRGERGRIVQTYDYLDAQGELLFQVCRMDPKSFRQRRPDGYGGWTWSVKGIELVPYRLPEVLKSQAIFIVEGEKDVDRLAELGLTATCNPQGAGKWRDSYAKHFQGKRVCILPDSDQPGRVHAHQVAASLHGVAEAVKILELPGLREKGDVSDWLQAGGTKNELLRLAKEAPEWSPLDQDDGTTGQERPHALDLFQPAEWTAARFLDGPLEELDFVFQDSLPTRNVAALAGPQGAGKGHFILHGCMAVASGEKAFLPIWNVPKPRKVLILAAEDDSRTLQRRCRSIAEAADLAGNLSLHPDRVSQLLRQNLHIYPLTGSDLKLIANDHGNAVASPVFDKLRAAAGRIQDLGLIVLDPLSRWHGGDENDNNVGTTLISLLEQLKDETGATVLIVHHVNKRAGYPGGKFSLNAALHMDAMRGASAISGGIRWQLNLTPLPAEFAKKELGVPAKEGQFLACRVSKKNHGAPEDVVYLERGQHGTLQVVDRSQTQAEIDAEEAIIDWLRWKIAKQDADGLPGLTKRSAAECWREVDAPGVTKTLFKEVTERAILNGELHTIPGKNASGKRVEYLSLTPENDSEKPYPNSGKEPAENRQPGEPAEPAETLPVCNHLESKNLRTGSDENRQNRQENAAGLQVPEIIEPAEPAEPASLKRGERAPTTCPAPSSKDDNSNPLEADNKKPRRREVYI